MRNVLTSIYAAKAKDLNVIPELLAVNDIFTQHKNLLEFCRHIHNGELPSQEALTVTLDKMDGIVVALRELVEERYA